MKNLKLLFSLIALFLLSSSFTAKKNELLISELKVQNVKFDNKLGSFDLVVVDSLLMPIDVFGYHDLFGNPVITYVQRAIPHTNVPYTVNAIFYSAGYIYVDMDVTVPGGTYNYSGNLF